MIIIVNLTMFIRTIELMVAQKNMPGHCYEIKLSKNIMYLL